MYFSISKRKMMFRIALFALFLVSLQAVYHSLWIYSVVCSSSPPFLNFICKSSKDDQWNIFYHLGGNGPWIRRAEEGSEQLPLRCSVDQMHMISRHAERYPTINAGARHIALLQRLQATDVKLSDSLAFLKEWTYFTNISDPDFENLTTHGPYAGTKQAFMTGQKLQQRYHELVNLNKTTNFWTCSSGRDIATAQHFADGFFGEEWDARARAKLHVIPETADRGADTLTPGDTCLRYIEDKVQGHDRGYTELAQWQRTFAQPIAQRLQAEAGGLSFSPIEIYSMMELCGFEILVRGSSPWCQVFSREEWLDFEYGRDLLHFYRAGPGNDFAKVMGWLWLNATTTLMTDESARGVYLSFVHDGDIVPLLAALGILNESKTQGILPNNKRRSERKWKTSDVVPMGGRLIFERVTCENTGLGENLRRSYVRLFINDGIVNLENSMFAGGLANSIGLAHWAGTIQKKGIEFGSFSKVCGLTKGAPSKITFLQPQYQQ